MVGEKARDAWSLPVMRNGKSKAVEVFEGRGLTEMG
jgi:hypothetical protein